MVLETSDVALWKIMQRILRPFSMDFNRKYKITGHVFESRYTACIIEDDRYLLEVSRYIHLNPVKAAMVAYISIGEGELFGNGSKKYGNGRCKQLDFSDVKGQDELIEAIVLAAAGGHSVLVPCYCEKKQKLHADEKKAQIDVDLF